MTITAQVEYTDPSQHQYDADKVEISGGEVKLKPLVKTTELFYWNFAIDATLVPERGVFALTLEGTANTGQVLNGELRLENDDSSRARIASVIGIANDFTFYSKCRVNFTSIASSQTVARILSNADSSEIQYQLVNQGAGVTRLVRNIYNASGVLSHTDILQLFTFAIGDQFDFGIARDTIGGTFRDHVNGANLGTVTDVVMNMTDCDIIFGTDGVAATNFSIDDPIMWTDVQNLTYAGIRSDWFLYEMETELVFTTLPFLMDEIINFAAVETVPANTHSRYVIGLNSTPYWYNATNTDWEVSDLTLAQSNTATEINDNVSTFPLIKNVGGIVQVLSVLKSDTGYETMTLESFTFVYDFTFQQQELGTCIVYGEVTDNSGDPIPNALIEFDSKNRVQSNVMVFPKSKTETNAEGQWALQLVETETSDSFGTIVVTYDNDGVEEVETYKKRIIPNLPLVKFEDLAEAP